MKKYLLLSAFITSATLMGAIQSHATEVSTTTTTAPAAAEIGVTECDDYLNKYESCVNSKVPEASRASMKVMLDQTRQQWKAAVTTADAKTALATSCKAALDAAKTSMQAFGCTW